MDIRTMDAMIEKIIYQMQTLKPDANANVALDAYGNRMEMQPIDRFEWPQGVALFAMYQYYQETRSQSMLGYLQGWFDEQLARGLPGVNVNTTCPMLTLTYLVERLPKPAYQKALCEWIQALLRDLPRTEEGGFQHETSNVRNDGQLWDDTLYMTVLFVARMGVLLADDALVQESIHQFLVHVKYLFDAQTGLFYHGFTFHGRHHFAGAKWGRGNAWYTAGLVDYLDMVALPAGVREHLVQTLRTQVYALMPLQDVSGLWHTLLDDPDSYLETSASSGFAYGILKAVRTGLLPASYEAMGIRCAQGVWNQIDPDGIVQGVSWGTPVFDNLQAYRDVMRCPMPYGQSMALLMLIEWRKHLPLANEKVSS